MAGKQKGPRPGSRGPDASGNEVSLQFYFALGARHRRRWASRVPGPQPALVTGALDPGLHFAAYHTLRPMTDSWIDSCRGSVAAWEVDHVGHFTVAYYHQRIEDAGFAVLEALGLGPASARDEGRGCVTAGCYVRYLHELRGGDIYHVRSGVLAIEEEALVVGHRLFESASGALCTTVEQRVAHVDVQTDGPIALAAAQRRAAEAHRVDWQEPPPERRPRPRGDEGFVDGCLDTVKPSEMNVLGRGGLAHYVHRFSASGGHLMAAFGMTPAYMRAEQRGLSTFEFQLSVTAALCVGDLVRVESA